ncbi:Cys-tRNA(Pro)/Cys-tRNA(Cys) deacylase [Neobacillus sp. B4I6]|jgi:Cys-tRNA(Pro)/Cys-tRNA(Cys) deacylase|uniref:Cys-tRNA(Pro) deacylase n=1 Tax=Neobacillus sp. B4I6 TaxID=3373925 RepID=UPI003D2326E1
MGKKEDKTNVMRILDKMEIKYNYYSFDSKRLNTAVVANPRGQQDLAMVFKTLVTVGKSKEYYVFMVPIEKELDLKKAAKVAGEKSIEMIPQRELLPLTGYVHGGCSPIGMKKQFRTFIDYTAENFETIYFSGGRVGHQIQLTLSDLQKVIRVTFAEITKDM